MTKHRSFYRRLFWYVNYKQSRCRLKDILEKLDTYKNCAVFLGKEIEREQAAYNSHIKVGALL